MSEETILSISSIPFFHDCDFFINLGNVGRTMWSLHPKWEKSGELVYLEILRTTNAGKIELEINLQYYATEYDNYTYSYDISKKTFKAFFEEGQKAFRILTGWSDYFEEPNRKLKGTVTIYDCIRCSKCPIKSPTLKSLSTLSNLSDNLLMLFNNSDSFTDATLKCGTVEIPVHKNILSVRSPVFAAMFKSQMQEGQGVVDIADIEASVLKSVLKFIYSGKTDSLNDVVAGDLLFAADKYQLEELKLICIAKLKSSVTVDNVSRILVLGNLHDESLKSFAKEFICKNYKFSDLEKTEEWNMLEQEHPDLTIEVLKFVVKYAEEN